MSVRAIVLAAGKGTRMKSSRPKVLHELCGRSMLWWSLDALRRGGVDDVTIVTSPEVEAVLDGAIWPGSREPRRAVQHVQAGTGDAVRVALDALPVRDGTVLITYADMPLLGEALLRETQAALAGEDVALALVTARMPLPSSFGRVVRGGERVERIVEARDATSAELHIEEMNAGVYAFDEAALRDAIARIGNDNAQAEYYLTDAIALLVAAGRGVVAVRADDYRSVLGINDRVELASARAALNARLCEALMRDGATIVDPLTTYVEPGVTIGTDTVVYPGSSIGGTSTIGSGCRIGPHTRIDGSAIGDGVRIVESVVIDSRVGAGTTIGPFAHLRGGSRLGANVRIGNYVELKNAELAEDVKANHLSYVGDSRVGARSNIGAGTITANFDGVKKNRTEIGSDVKIGTNTSLVAPVSVGDGAVTGAGTVVIRDIPAGECVVGNPARSISRKQ